MLHVDEKKSHIWWDRFEIHLTNAFSILDRNAGCQVHTDEMKLLLLNKKVRAYFLTIMKTNLEMQMNMVPINIAYSSAL